jgi:non-ribosomal peptide synthetase component F/acyl carrier protein
MIEQAGMVNHLFAKITQLSLSGADVIMEMAPQSFDVCVWQFFAVLLVGGRVCIIDDVIVQDPVLLLEEFERQGVTVIEVVPSQLTSLIEAIVSAENDKPQLSAVRWMIATGEALPPELCRQWLALYPGIPMMNCYGPTECSDDVTHYFTSVPPPADVSRMSIGRRVPNMRIYVVDEALSPVAAGVHGELFAGGVGVGRGYLNDPVRTAEVFVPDPFSNEPGARLYKTGDLARYRFDRDIEFISRKDFQVKIRGFRIEIGEIEALLNQHPGVREAIVLVREYKPNDKRLVAYVVWNQEQAGQVSELRSLLKERLPGYMVPSAVVVMPQLPLTPNGKVNRAALPLPDSVAQDQTDEPPMQLTPYEEVLSGIWIEVLGIKQVSPGDNFFELGGHSLLATQLVARVRKAFDVELPLAFLFEDPTISGLARGVEAAMKSLDWAKLPPVKPVQRAGHLPLSFAQQRLWILDQLESGSPFYNCAAGIKLRGELRVAALERVCTELVRRHEVLRTAFPAVEGQPVQVISPPAPFNLPLIDLAGLPEAEREAELSRVGHENAKQPFDLARGPLLRIRLLKLHDQEHAAFLAMHHIVSDGWSMGLLINEIGELYSAYSKGQESPLPDLAIQYADFAHWQRSWLQGEMLENHLSYWRRQLSGTLPVLKLPVDRALAGGGSDSGARCSFNISQEITEQLRALSRREGVTLFMTLLAAFKTLLYRYSGQQDILVGTAIANRNRAELENIIGFFVNMLVIRASLSGNPSFNKLLAQVREVSLGAYAHQDLPFEKLVEELRPERHQSNVPIFQVAFGLQNAPAQALELPGLQLVPVDSDFETVRFDLTVWVAERNNRLIVIWRYRRDLFDQSTIARMHSHYERLLESIVAQPDSPIDSLQMLTGEEKRMRDDARRERERSNTSKLRTIRRKSVSATKEPPALENL